MKIRYEAPLKLLYKDVRQPIAQSPEWVFVQKLCSGQRGEAVALFEETKQFGKRKSAVDAPFGRFEGQAGIDAFARRWLSEYRAESAFAEAYFQTSSGGRSVTEIVVSFVADGMIHEVPMVVVGDLRAHAKLDEVRIYHHCTFLPQYQPYRKPIFQSAHLEMGDPDLLTGAVREYYLALHQVPRLDVDRILACTSEHCRFGGYSPTVEAAAGSREVLRKEYEHMATYIPRWVGMRYETLIDDGVTCVIEWVHIVSEDGQKEGGRVCLSGVAAYQRDESGRLCSIRICDYAGYEKRIEWQKVPDTTKEEAFAFNLVKTFPAGCGRKEQISL